MTIKSNNHPSDPKGQIEEKVESVRDLANDDVNLDPNNEMSDALNEEKDVRGYYDILYDEMDEKMAKSRKEEEEAPPPTVFQQPIIEVNETYVRELLYDIFNPEGKYQKFVSAHVTAEIEEAMGKEGLMGDRMKDTPKESKQGRLPYTPQNRITDSSKPTILPDWLLYRMQHKKKHREFLQFPMWWKLRHGFISSIMSAIATA